MRTDAGGRNDPGGDDWSGNSTQPLPRSVPSSGDPTQVIPGARRPRSGAGGADTSTSPLPISSSKDPGELYVPYDAGEAPASAASRPAAPRPAAPRPAPDPVRAPMAAPNREALLEREKSTFGGMRIGAGFFGWLSAIALTVLLSAVAGAIAAAVGTSTDFTLNDAESLQGAAVTGAVILLAVLLLSYFAGGYVAGRMSRFSGLQQGLAVWLWGLLAAAVVIVLGLVFGADLDTAGMDAVVPLDLQEATAGAWIAVGIMLAATLLGALLGGLAGMRYHRRIDRADFSGY